MRRLGFGQGARRVAALCSLLVWAAGCASSDWRAALTLDTPAAYHLYLRDHPASGHAEEAREHLAYHALLKSPSIDHYLEFIRAYPQTRLVTELKPRFEEQAFQAAMTENSVAAYRGFIDSFPDSPLAPRAVGNVVYREAGGFSGDPAALGAFAREHQQSDYARESRRTLEALSRRESERFDRIGLRIEIQPGVPQLEKLAATFRRRATDYYRAVGLELIEAPPSMMGDSAGIEASAGPQAILTIRHSETPVRAAESQAGGGSVAKPSLAKPDRLVETIVSVDLGNERIGSRTTNLRLTAAQVARVDSAGSAVFSSAASQYWDDFFVPVVSWPTRESVHEEYALSQKSVAVDAAADRAVVLFESGGFQVFGLADPARPAMLAEYRRDKKFGSWRGVRILDSGILVFGQDGLEIIRVGAESLEAEVSYTRGDVGSIAAVEPVPGGMLLAGSRGLVMMTNDAEPPQRILRRVTRALAKEGDQLFFSDGEVLFISTLERLQQNALTGQLRLGADFGAHRIRALGSWIAVLGEQAVLLVDVSNPAKPKPIARLDRAKVGRVDDAVESGGRIFLLGQRGLQLLDPTGQSVVEHIFVTPASSMARMGRHLAIVGAHSMQVVDSLPFTASVAPASIAIDARAP